MFVFPVLRLQDYNSYWFWCLLPGGWDCSGAWAGFLVGKTGVFSLVGGARSYPSEQGLSRAVLAQDYFHQPVCWWVGLCFYPVCCLVWGVPEMEPAGCFVGPGLTAKMVTSRRAHADEYSMQYLPPASLPSQWASHSWLPPPQDIL